MKGNLKVEQEWTVEKILLHAGSGENSHIEILWKAGDMYHMASVLPNSAFESD